jgi:valyl-tRNA synthetase
MSEMPKAYEPATVEARWYKFWEDNQVFAASLDPKDTRPTYVVSMPPPNVTGSLHMGHALFGTIQDALIRHKRMQGYNTLWQPGMDHAGIATQTVVERQLKREGLSRQDLGRAKFQERVWQWKEQSGGRILEQLRVLGCSADWSRLKFTMDPDMSRAVREAFVRMYEEGLIYRDTRLINWDWESHTALSDLEVENEEATGELYEFAYPVAKEDARDGATELVVATTRPETMLGDSAVAVHPDDPRYKHLHGKTLRHPFVDRDIPIITDSILVDMEFGTGAVKVTPAHDFNDFATGKRHQLQEISILTIEGKINELGGQFAGLTVLEARKAVKAALADLGLERGSKPHKLQLPKSQRSGVVVEPMISTQWFLNTKPLAEAALAAVANGETVILPEEWRKTYDHWLNTIQDWCISRQLWWGHRIPAWHCQSCGHISVAREDPSACEACKSASIERDPDVLDTWFSSGLWPFSTLGWPDKTLELERFYPSDDMETGYDIIFFWVARMMMMGIHFMGKPPFSRILLHGLVVDETGDKMSKVKGNTIDPLDLIHGSTFEQVVHKALPGAKFDEAFRRFKKSYPSVAQFGTGFPEYGTDALRFTLSSYSPQAKRIALSPKRIEGYRNFCNKIYNAVRYSMTYIEGLELLGKPKPTLLINRWILSRMVEAVETSTRGIEQFRLDEGSSALYKFVWNELCDWFLELSKPIFSGNDEAAKAETAQVLAHTIETALRALHPYIPFVTEELWQRVPRPAGRPISVALAAYPTADDGVPDAQAEQEMQLVIGAVVAGRTVRSEHQIHPGAKVSVRLRSNNAKSRQVLQREILGITTLVKTEGAPVIEPAGAERHPGYVVTVAGDVEVLVGLKGLVEADKEQARISRQLTKLDKDIRALDQRLSNPKFVEKAPPEVVQEAQEQLAGLREQQQRLVEAQALLREL